MERRRMITIWSVSTAIILISIGFLSPDVGVRGNLAIFSTFLIAGPQLMFKYMRYREFKEMEERFPDLLRDLTESIRSGVPLHKAIQVASRFDYGKRLNKEIKTMSSQISWGMTADKVLDKFAKRVKRSRRIYTAVRIVRESYLSGGDIAAILDSVADSCTMLEEMEKERKSVMSQYTLLMYAISIIFIIIVIAINKFLLPIFKSAALGAIGLVSPCEFAYGLGEGICGLFDWTAKYVLSVEPGSVAAYYISLFFFMSIIQALFSGIIAGQISEGSPTAGIKHSFILIGIIFGMFTIFLRLGFLGV